MVDYVRYTYYIYYNFASVCLRSDLEQGRMTYCRAGCPLPYCHADLGLALVIIQVFAYLSGSSGRISRLPCLKLYATMSGYRLIGSAAGG